MQTPLLWLTSILLGSLAGLLCTARGNRRLGADHTGLLAGMGVSAWRGFSTAVRRCTHARRCRPPRFAFVGLFRLPFVPHTSRIQT